MTDTQIANAQEVKRFQVNALVPPVDVLEDASGIRLYADLPGVPKDKLSVRVEADVLSIEAEVSLAQVSNMEAHHAEVHLPRYQRSFTLGQELDRDKVSADFKNGVLRLYIPKAEHAKPRKIEITVD